MPAHQLSPATRRAGSHALCCCLLAPAPACVQDFELTVSVDKMVREADRDYNGWLSYDEFKTLLT